VITDLDSLREYIQREGMTYSGSGCMWADEHAFKVVAEKLQLALVFVDMDRDGEEWPYRVLAVPPGGRYNHVVVLKREKQSHFRPLGEVLPGGGSRCCCFEADELPEVIRALWADKLAQEQEKARQAEAEAASPAAAPGAAAAAEGADRAGADRPAKRARGTAPATAAASSSSSELPQRPSAQAQPAPAAAADKGAAAAATARRGSSEAAGAAADAGSGPKVTPIAER